MKKPSYKEIAKELKETTIAPKNGSECFCSTVFIVKGKHEPDCRQFYNTPNPEPSECECLHHKPITITDEKCVCPHCKPEPKGFTKGSIPDVKYDWLHDAPQFMWTIHTMLENDEVFECEKFIYDVFHKLLEEKKKELKAKIAIKMINNDIDAESIPYKMVGEKMAFMDGYIKALNDCVTLIRKDE
jgi:hypothetical protein